MTVEIEVKSGGGYMGDGLVSEGAVSGVMEGGVFESADHGDGLDSSRQERERILFVDDDEILAEVGCMMLEHLGYGAECHTDPVKALDVFKSRTGAFGMVITDMSMPEMSGHELAAEIYKISPELPVILCTGYDVPADAPEYGETGIRAVVTKPMGMEDFAGVIEDVLAQRSPG